MEKKKISIVVPCYNEEEMLPLFIEAITPVLKSIENYAFELCFVNDGSKDKTLEILEQLHSSRDDVTYVSLAKNYGQNSAFRAGLENCSGDYAIMMDADLQNPVELIVEIAKKFDEGYDVVNPRMVSRKNDSGFKRSSASSFYSLANKIEGKEIIPDDVNCFRGISRRVIDAMLENMSAGSMVLMDVPQTGFKTCFIEYERGERAKGTSKYSLKKMIKYAFDNLSAGTFRPLYLILPINICVFFFASLVAITLTVLYILGINGIIYSSPLYLVFMIISYVLLFIAFIGVQIGIMAMYQRNILINSRMKKPYVVETVKKSKQ